MNEKVQCNVCGGEMEIIHANYALNKEGIEVFIIGGQYYSCSCGNEQLPTNVAKMVDKLVKEKKEKYPHSQPYIYLNLL